jgi:hypothetical protein
MPQCVVTTTERAVYNAGAGYGFSITTIQGIPAALVRLSHGG